MLLRMGLCKPPSNRMTRSLLHYDRRGNSYLCNSHARDEPTRDDVCPWELARCCIQSVAAWTGINIATLFWIAKNYGIRPSILWFSALALIVLLCAYAVDRPLIPLA